MTMTTYQIHEETNGAFVAVEARTASAALRRAAREYPRLRADYNLAAGETCSVTWRAFPVDGDRCEAVAIVPVPSRGDRRVEVEAL